MQSINAQNEMAFAKLDTELKELFNNGNIVKSERVPVVVRCSSEEFPGIDKEIADLGGFVRQHVVLIGAIAAWLPIESLQLLASSKYVTALELEQEYSMA